MLINTFTYTFCWLTFLPEVVLLQVLLLYYTLRLFNVSNYYQLVGYTTLILLILAGYLFWLQFDVFACFLLVAELVVMLFILTTILHINYTNLSKLPYLYIYIPLLFILFCWQGFTPIMGFSYWVDWYESQSSQFSDLLGQFIFFYHIDTHIVPLIGVWLLVLTFLLVFLILNISFTKNTLSNSLFYTKKIQNIWTQWYVKPFIRFFNK